MAQRETPSSLFDDDVDFTNAISYPGQPSFDFINHSAWPACVNVRRVLDAWFSRYPRNHRAALRGHFRSPNEMQHSAALFELYLHELMTRLGNRMTIHPRVGRTATRRPDFRVHTPTAGAFYLEATTLSSQFKGLGKAGLTNPFMRALEKVTSTDYVMMIHTEGSPTTPPSARTLRPQLERWIAALDYDTVVGLWEHDRDRLPTFTWSHEDWTLRFTAIPKGERRDVLDPVTHGAMMPQAGINDLKTPLKRTIRNKASAYGRVRIPFVVAVNVLDPFLDDIHLHETMLGDERWEIVTTTTGHDVRYAGPAPNGLFTSGGRPRNTHLSAVMVFRSLLPWNMHRDLVDVYVNPFARRALSANALPFKGWVPRDGKMEKTDGRNPGNILGLPSDWPGERTPELANADDPVR